MNFLRNIFVFMELFYGFHLSAYVVDEDSYTLLELQHFQQILQDDILYVKRRLLTNLSARVHVLEEKADLVTDEHDRHNCECKNTAISAANNVFDKYRQLLEAFKDEKQECRLISNELETHKLDKVKTDLSLRGHADAIQNIETFSDKLENDIKKANNVLEKLEKDVNDKMKQERDDDQKLNMYGSPSFISDWFLMRSQDASLCERMVHHGLGTLPYKVEVQIRPVAGPNAGWTFRGDSVYQSDDDPPGHRYGGIVYLYDNETVFLTAPHKRNDKASGTVINTGEELQFRLGNNHQISSEAYVRVKVWGQDKWPTPDFESEWIPLDIYNETRAFHEIPHGLGDYPGFVNVQIRCFSETKFYVSEGVGASVKSSAYWHNNGGTVWAFNNQNTRVWTGYVQSKGKKHAYNLIGTRDGWPTSENCPNSIGEVRVTAWKSKSFLPEKNFHVRHNNDTVFPEWVAPLPENLDMEKDLASLYVQAEDGPNVGYRFPAYGNSQTISPSYGGVVYAFHPTGAVRLWRPNPDKEGFLVHIQHPYGNGINVQKSNNAIYILSVIKGTG